MTTMPTPVPLGRPRNPQRVALVRELRGSTEDWVVASDPTPSARGLVTALRDHYLRDGEKLRSRRNTDGSVSLRIES